MDIPFCVIEEYAKRYYFCLDIDKDAWFRDITNRCNSNEDNETLVLYSNILIFNWNALERIIGVLDSIKCMPDYHVYKINTRAMAYLFIVRILKIKVHSNGNSVVPKLARVLKDLRLFVHERSAINIKLKLI